MSTQSPSPERIASWEQQALALLAEHSPEDKVLAHLRYVGCPAETAREIIARNRGAAKSQRRRKGIGIAATGAALIAIAILILVLRALGVPIPLAAWTFWFLIVGIGMLMYGGLQMLFG
jgi:hypothetical protein